MVSGTFPVSEFNERTVVLRIGDNLEEVSRDRVLSALRLPDPNKESDSTLIPPKYANPLDDQPAVFRVQLEPANGVPIH